MDKKAKSKTAGLQRAKASDRVASNRKTGKTASLSAKPRFPASPQPLSFRVAIVGSGAASLNAAVQLKRLGIDDMVVITEGVKLGTSANAGSDKQTYYRLSPGGASGDSVLRMARDLFSGGSMHGDTALVEAALSMQCFSHLCTLGVEFPFDRYGIYPGYRTDHDTAGRATSAGPQTSITMHEKLLAECRRLGVAVIDRMSAVRIITEESGKQKKACGLLAVDGNGRLQMVQAEYVVWGTGGPSTLYADSVYPKRQNGSLGIALAAGARACNLTESQFGIASVDPRWNLSGSFQQVLPNYYSCEADGSGKRYFLAEHFPNQDDMLRAIFLKGYEWPFDVRKMPGSSEIDLLVHRERVVHRRRVFMDFTCNPAYPGRTFSLSDLPAVARGYLERSRATGNTPVKRLREMNPAAYEVFLDKGFDLAKKPLEVAVCNQHLNGGLAVDKWWETSIGNLFAVGEAAGTHGVYRPGGSALNSGQVGGLRAAQCIANRIRTSKGSNAGKKSIEAQVRQMSAMMKTALARSAKIDPEAERRIMQSRASATLGITRGLASTERAISENAAQLKRHLSSGVKDEKTLKAWLQNIDLLMTEMAMLDASMALLQRLERGRGSFVVSRDRDGLPSHLEPAASPGQTEGKTLKPASKDSALTDRVIETWIDASNSPHSDFIPVRPVPEPGGWFESIWAGFFKGEVYRS